MLRTRDPRSRGSAAEEGIRSYRRGVLLLRQLTGQPGPAPGVPIDRRTRAERRSHSLRSFAYGSLRPRRRIGRRAGDHDRIFLDWHEPRVLYVALAILLMSCADALFTLNLLAAGGEELNVVMAILLRQDSGRFLWAKIGVTAVSVVVLVVAARRPVLGWFRVQTLLQVVCAGYALLIGYELYLLGWYATNWADETGRALLRWAAHLA